MSSLEEIAMILYDNLLTCLDGGTTYIVHKDDFVTVKDSNRKSWHVFKKGLRYEGKVDFDPLRPFITIIEHPEYYEPGIRVYRIRPPPSVAYNMSVLVKSGNGELIIEKLDYDETLIENAEKNGVKVQIWEQLKSK